MKISILNIPHLVKGSILNSPTRLEKLARKTKWMQRQAKKLTPIKFVHGILHAVSQGDASFRLLATAIGIRLDSDEKIDHELDYQKDSQPFGTISKPALWERVNPGAVEFFKLTLEELLKAQKITTHSIPDLPSITRIIVEDSALLTLAQRLAEECPATNNQHGAKGAGKRFQAAFDLISGEVVRLALTEYGRNDQKATSDIIPILQENDLLIRDLGYLVNSALNEIIDKGAHFLSRHLGARVIHHTEENGGKRIDLLAYLETHAPNTGDEVDIDVVMGSGPKKAGKVKCRLVARKVPKQVEENRLRKIHADEKRLGKQRSKRHKKFQGWEIYITSLPRNGVSVEKICELYPLRWRIEIIFKAFKSYTPLNDLAAHCSNANHVQVLLYAWLCLVVLAAQTGSFALAKKTGPSGALQPNCLSLLKVIPKVFQMLNMSLVFSCAVSIREIMARWMYQCEYHDRYERRTKRTNMAQLLENALGLNPSEPLLS